MPRKTKLQARESSSVSQSNKPKKTPRLKLKISFPLENLSRKNQTKPKKKNPTTNLYSWSLFKALETAPLEDDLSVPYKDRHTHRSNTRQTGCNLTMSSVCFQRCPELTPIIELDRKQCSTNSKFSGKDCSQIFVALLRFRMASVTDGLLQGDILLRRKLKAGTSARYSLMP